MKLTKEQLLLVNDNEQTNILVQAFAGTGKTTTLIEYAKNHPKEKILYLAFNKSIQLEASKKFPENTVCKTIHSIAYNTTKRYISGGTKLKKLEFNIDNKTLSTAVTKIIKKKVSYIHIYNIKNIINNFLISSDKNINHNHLNGIISNQTEEDKKQKYNNNLIYIAKKIFNRMIDKYDPFPFTHDTYLKYYQLNKPTLTYSTIMFDEVQDANSTYLDIISNQTAKLIFVGDKHQQIYRFLGATNTIDLISKNKNFKLLHLTKTFRFGKNLVDLANQILVLKNENLKIKSGIRTNTNIILDDNKKNQFIKNTSIITRTNAMAIQQAIEIIKIKNQKIFWIGSIKSYNFDHILDIYYLAKGLKEKIKNPAIIINYNNYSQYLEEANTSNNIEMLAIIKILKTYTNFHKIKILLEKNVSLNKNDINITTAHKSKGLEWNNVILANDFDKNILIKLNQNLISLDKFNDEINLLYVACTRASKNLIINDAIKNLNINLN